MSTGGLLARYLHIASIAGVATSWKRSEVGKVLPIVVNRIRSLVRLRGDESDTSALVLTMRSLKAFADAFGYCLERLCRWRMSVSTALKGIGKGLSESHRM